MAQRPASLSEETPLITANPQYSQDEETQKGVSFSRGLLVLIFMGLLIFIQG
jgi:hypothetical protein